MKLITIITIALTLAACTSSTEQGTPKSTNQPESRPASTAKTTPEHPATSLGRVEKADEEWREQLTPEQYRITRQAGTERAFSGQYWNEKHSGSYLCVCCDLELFDSKTKYKSGTGWPSFWEPSAEGHVAEETDFSLGGVRTEVHCARCDSHLGHVFTDGPEPTGLRYCINSASLVLRED